MVISMKPLRILLNNTFTSGIEHLQSAAVNRSNHPVHSPLNAGNASSMSPHTIVDK